MQPHEPRYGIQRSLTAKVDLARDNRLNRWVVIKHAVSEIELQVCATIAPWRPALLDLTDHNDAIFEYWPNPSLAQWFEHPRLDPKWARAVATNLIDAIAQLHAEGWIHGDLHPGNVLADSRGQIRLIDFASAHIPGATPRTHHLAYSSPEALAGEACTEPCDTYSLGKLLIELNRRVGLPSWQAKLNASQHSNPADRATLEQMRPQPTRRPTWMLLALCLYTTELTAPGPPPNSLREQIRESQVLGSPSSGSTRREIPRLLRQPLNKL